MSDKFKIQPGDSGNSPGSYWTDLKLATIDVTSEESLEKWGNLLHLSRSELLDSIKKYGNTVRDIRVGRMKDHGEAA